MYIGGEMTRLALAPFFPFFGANVDMWGQRLITVFEEKENVDKLILWLEQMSRGEYDDGSEVDSSEDTEEEASDN